MKTTSLLRLSRLAPLLSLALGACAVPIVTPDPVPPPDLLRAADCQPAAVEYRKRLELMQPQSQGAWNPANLAADFQKDCEARLAGHARRIVLRCWRDSMTAKAFLACNERF